VSEKYFNVFKFERDCFGTTNTVTKENYRADFKSDLTKMTLSIQILKIALSLRFYF
jgi:hypothetical protein